jgi:hypothetical protein
MIHVMKLEKPDKDVFKENHKEFFFYKKNNVK